MSLTDEEREILQRLLKGKSPSDFTPAQLVGKAAARAKRGEDLEAAVLYLAAEQVGKAKGGLAAHRAVAERFVAGIYFCQAGATERAWPILEEAATFDWKAAKLSVHRHYTELAFVAMLSAHHANGDTAKFCETFQRAITRGEELDLPFPSKDSSQDALLVWCVDLRQLDLFFLVKERALATRGNSTKLKSQLRTLGKQLGT